MISSNSNFNNGLEKFVVKLPFTTGSKNNATVKTCKGFEGILKKIKEFQRNPTVNVQHVLDAYFRKTINHIRYKAQWYI